MIRGFRHRKALPELPKGAERPIIEQFQAIEGELDRLRGQNKASVTPVLTQASVAAALEQLILLAPPDGGTLVMIPAGSSENVGQKIRIAVVGGILSPGATVSIVGRQGTINGQQSLAIASIRLVELHSCGAIGWFFST